MFLSLVFIIMLFLSPFSLFALQSHW